MLKWLARLCMSGVFILGGYEAFTEPAPRSKRLPNVGMPESELAVKVNAATMVVSGIALGLGIFPRLAALILLGSMLPTTLAGHPFWKKEQEGTMKQRRIQFTKNLGLIGGLLLVLASSDNKKTEE